MPHIPMQMDFQYSRTRRVCRLKEEATTAAFCNRTLRSLSDPTNLTSVDRRTMRWRTQWEEMESARDAETNTCLSESDKWNWHREPDRRPSTNNRKTTLDIRTRNICREHHELALAIIYAAPDAVTKWRLAYTMSWTWWHGVVCATICMCVCTLHRSLIFPRTVYGQCIN